MGLNQYMLAFNNWYNGVNKIKAALKKDENALRTGVLSTANINYTAIIDPIQTHPGAVLYGIASRDRSKAQESIDKLQLGPTCKAFGSYDDLLADSNIDAVYIPLPNGLHLEWAVKAMEAGKHVLIEKPLVSNADQARQLLEVASRTNKVALEAFHWRFHPAAHKVKSLIDSGKYGSPTSIYARMAVPSGTIGKDNIRLKYDLAGGACMDLTYIFSASCYFASQDISKCTFTIDEALPRLNENDSQVDEAIECKFTINQDDKPPVNCHVEGDLVLANFLGFIPPVWKLKPLAIIEMERAKIEFNNFVIPTYGHSITITEKDGKGNLTAVKHTEKFYVDGPHWGRRGEPWWTSYRYQLEAFVSMIKAKDAGADYHGPWMSLEESEKLMELIDAVYGKAKLLRRGL